MRFCIFGKTKAIDLHLITDISVYSSIIPILTFLLFKRTRQERIKWVCFLLILLSPLFDVIAIKTSKSPVATGYISSIKVDSTSYEIMLTNLQGKIYKGQLLIADEFKGIIKQVYPIFTETGHIPITIEKAKDNEEIDITGLQYRVHSNQNIENIYLLIESIFFFILFYYSLKVKNKWGLVIFIIVLVAMIIWIIRNLFLDKLFLHDAYFNGGVTITLIALSLVYFYSQLNLSGNFFIYSQPSFWIVTAILIFKSGTFFLLLYLGTLKHSEQAEFYVINSGFNILKNLLFTIAFLIKSPKYLPQIK